MTGAHPKEADELKPHATKSKFKKKNAVFVNKIISNARRDFPFIRIQILKSLYTFCTGILRNTMET